MILFYKLNIICGYIHNQMNNMKSFVVDKLSHMKVLLQDRADVVAVAVFIIILSNASSTVASHCIHLIPWKLVGILL